MISGSAPTGGPPSKPYPKWEAGRAGEALKTSRELDFWDMSPSSSSRGVWGGHRWEAKSQNYIPRG